MKANRNLPVTSYHLIEWGKELFVPVLAPSPKQFQPLAAPTDSLAVERFKRERAGLKTKFSDTRSPHTVNSRIDRAREIGGGLRSQPPVRRQPEVEARQAQDRGRADEQGGSGTRPATMRHGTR